MKFTETEIRNICETYTDINGLVYELLHHINARTGALHREHRERESELKCAYESLCLERDELKKALKTAVCERSEVISEFDGYRQAVKDIVGADNNV